MTGKQLRNSILQWAIQGKLVPQDPNDEPASVLLERIRAEKARLVKEKKIKKDKNETIIFRGEDNLQLGGITCSANSYYEKTLATGTVRCINDEIPFDIPNGWEWCRLRTICKQLTDGTHNTPHYTEYGIPFISVKDMSSGKITFSNTRFISFEEHEILSARCNPEKGDLLLSKVGTTGIPALVVDNRPFSIFVSLALIKFFNNEINTDYLIHLINSPLVQEQAKANTRGVGNKNWVLSAIADTLIVIPSKNQQKYIVEFLNGIEAKINSYNELSETFAKLNTNVKNKLSQSILQEAIQGRLVPQISSDGTAKKLLEDIRAEKQRLVKEGKLKKSAIANESRIFRGADNKYYENTSNGMVCIDDEIPFEIPKSWTWVRLDNICEYIQRGKSPKYSPIKKIPVIAQKCNQWAGFQIDKAQFIEPNTLPSYGKERFLQDGDLMWNSTGLGTLGRMAIYRHHLNPYGIAVADSHVTVIRPFNEYISSLYLFAYFTSKTVQSVIEEKSDGSTKQKELATTTVKNYIVPLPPLSEQKRIVQMIAHLTSILSKQL